MSPKSQSSTPHSIPSKVMRDTCKVFVSSGWEVPARGWTACNSCVARTDLTEARSFSEFWGHSVQELDVGTNHTQWLTQAGSTGLAGNRQLLSFTDSGGDAEAPAVARFRSSRVPDLGCRDNQRRFKSTVYSSQEVSHHCAGFQTARSHLC